VILIYVCFGGEPMIGCVVAVAQAGAAAPGKAAGRPGGGAQGGADPQGDKNDNYHSKPVDFSENPIHDDRLLRSRCYHVWDLFLAATGALCSTQSFGVQYQRLSAIRAHMTTR
jgi:hypothetical protein